MVGRVAGFGQDTLGHALVTGNLRHLITLHLHPEGDVEPAYLDSDVYGWCTPELEYLSVGLSNPKAEQQVVLDKCKFFVNLPKLQRLTLFFGRYLSCQHILEDIPETVTRLKMSGMDDVLNLPLLFQPGLEKLSFDGIYNLHLQHRHGSFAYLD